MNIIFIQIFSEIQETALANYLKTCAKMNYGLSVNNILCLAYQYAVEHKVPHPKGWEKSKKATKDWYYGFMKRNPTLSLRKPTPTSLARSKGFCKESVEEFFTNYSPFAQNYPPNRIYNADETNCPTVATKPGKVVAEKGSAVGRMASGEKGTNVTMCLAVNAAGESIPPFYLFPRKNMQRYFMDNATPGSVGYANGSGWMDTEHFIKYFNHFIQHTLASKDNPLLLIMDNHTSHISLPIVNLARDHGIEIVTLPPHCSHRLQPLDVGVFGPFKHYYDIICDDWSKSNAGRAIEIHHVAALADKALDESVNKKNIKAGFRRAGIFPLDRTRFGEKDFLATKLSGENQMAEQSELELHEDDRRSIFVVFDENDHPAAHEEVTTSEASTSLSSLQLSLSKMGPVQPGEIRKKSNRGRRAMQSTVLTSPESIAKLQEKSDAKVTKAIKAASTAAKRAEKAEANAIKVISTAAKKSEKAEAKKSKTAAPPSSKKKRPLKSPKTSSQKRKKMSSSSSDEDIDFCMARGCGKLLDNPMTKNNTIECNKCGRPFHLKCVTMRSFFTCEGCDSDLDVSDE